MKYNRNNIGGFVYLVYSFTHVRNSHTHNILVQYVESHHLYRWPAFSQQTDTCVNSKSHVVRQ